MPVCPASGPLPHTCTWAHTQVHTPTQLPGEAGSCFCSPPSSHCTPSPECPCHPQERRRKSLWVPPRLLSPPRAPGLASQWVPEAACLGAGGHRESSWASQGVGTVPGHTPTLAATHLSSISKMFPLTCFGNGILQYVTCSGGSDLLSVIPWRPTQLSVPGVSSPFYL